MKKDPFPMSTPEAERMAASLEGSHEAAAWSSMNTRTASIADVEEKVGTSGGEKQEDSQGLLPGSISKVKSGEDDIYGNIEQDEEDEEDKEDGFLDRPLWESRGSRWVRTVAATQRGLYRIYRRLYGDDLPISEMLRTLCMASSLLFLIGGYWILRSLKDAVVMALNGVEYIPKCKMASVGVVLVVVPIYNHVLDSGMPRHQLFYLFGSVYFCLFSCIALLLMHPTIGLANQQPSPYRLLGWIAYCGIESFGSVMVSLYWSFANSNFSLKTAKASYGVMVATGQIGSILGPTIVHHYSETWGTAKLFLLGSFGMLLLQVTVYIYVSLYGATERNIAGGGGADSCKPSKKQESAGIMEGIHLFIKYNYVKGIFAISCLFMIAGTIVDFTLKVLAQEHFSKEYPCETYMSCYDEVEGNHGMSEDATNAVTRFLGLFGQAANSLSFVMSLFGTSAVIRFLGLQWTLLLFPSLVLCVVVMVRLRPTLYIVFLAMILIKGFSYSLNNPTKEMLYQPTSQAVRYKAKSWIDTFGARGSKALGSVVTNAFSDSVESIVRNGTLIGIAVASFLIWNARFMGRTFAEYEQSGFIVGEEHTLPSEDGGTNVEMALAQSENPDNSCALEEDDEVGPEEEGQADEKLAFATGNAVKV